MPGKWSGELSDPGAPYFDRDAEVIERSKRASYVIAA
jgi:hypothetical protein